MSIWNKSFILLCLANLGLFISIHVLTPTLPLYLLDIGGSQRDVGYVMAAYTIGALLTRPVGGFLVDRFSRKKVLVLGMVIMLSVTLFYRMAGNVSLMLVIRNLHGVAFGLVSTALGTMVADILPPAHFGEGMGYFGLTNSLSMSLAPMIGFWIVGQSGFPMLFWAVNVLAALALCCGSIVKGTALPNPAKQGEALKTWERLLEKSALPPSIVIFFLAVVFGSIMSFISLYAEELGVSNIGLFFTCMALAMLVSRPIAGRWMDHGGVNKVMLIAHLAVFIGMSTVAYSHTITGFISGGIFIGIGFGFCVPTLQSLAVRDVSVRRRGAATATFFIFFDLGIGLGTIIWGYVAEATGYSTMFLTTLIPTILAGAAYYRLKLIRERGRECCHIELNN